MHAETCPVCTGSGLVSIPIYAAFTPKGAKPGDVVSCHGCNGKGWVQVGDALPDSPPQYVKKDFDMTCPTCKGTGMVYFGGLISAPCYDCNGFGQAQPTPSQ